MVNIVSVAKPGTSCSVESLKVNNMGETREVMDMRQASDYLGVSREALYKYISAEQIPAFKLGNRWKFKKTVLDRWMERQSTQRVSRGYRRG